MTKAEQQLQAQAEKLRNQLADAEAVVAHLKAKIAKIDAKLTGEPTPETGLDMIWKAALPMGRQRSSKVQCRQAWNRIPAGERPKVGEVLAALKAWNRCDAWRRDGNQFVPGLHKWIAARQWDNIPEDVRPDPGARYRVAAPKPVSTADAVVDPQEIARLLSLKTALNPTESP